jgi:hypothetical protein
MVHSVKLEEFEAVSALPPAERYEHFVRQVADWEALWSLREHGGWVLLGDPDGNECVPVWPHAAYAEAFGKVAFPQSAAEAVALSAWLERWTAGLRRDRRRVAVFPVRDGARESALVVEPERLHADLERELRRYA